MSGPHQYRILVYETDGTDTFGVGDLTAEFRPLNVGYAKYLADVGEAFWTVMQDDPKLGLIDRSRVGDYHVKVLRDDEVIWRGLLCEMKSKRDDVVMYAYGYEGALFWMNTVWGMSWSSAKVGDDIVTDLWTRAKTGVGYSQLGFVTTGTIQNPVTTSGGSTAITLPTLKYYYKRLLFALKEMVALSTGDTQNTVYFEFAYTTSPTDNAVTFNFWKNRSTDRNDRWVYPVHIEDFDDQYAPLLTRNAINAVASGPRNQLFKSNQAKSGGNRGYENFGRHMEPIYIEWVRDQDGLDYVAKARLHKALRDDTNLTLKMKPEKIEPVGSSDADYKLGDTVTVKIDRGITQIDKRMFLQGMQTVSIRGAERCFPMLSDRNPT